MKEYHDKQRREEVFEIGDWVYLRLRPYQQHTHSQKALYRLGCRFYGLFQIMARVGEVAYKLKLPDDAQIHPVVHVSQLRRRLSDQNVIMGRLQAVNEDGNCIIRPIRAAEYRQIKRGDQFWWEVLIEWEGLPVEEATWENLKEIRNRFPEFILEDKDSLEGDENDENEGRGLKNAYNQVRRAKYWSRDRVF